MADVDLQKKVRDFQETLEEDQRALRDKLDSESKALDRRLKTDSALKEREGELKHLRERERAGTADGTERDEIRDDIRDTNRAIAERKAELERGRNAAREAWRASLTEEQRAQLDRLGADVSRADKGHGLTEPIIEQEARGAFEENHGRQDWSEDLGKTANGKETTLEFTKKNGKNYAVIIDSDGKVLEKIEYDPQSKSSVEKATKKIARLGLKDYPGERLILAFQMAFLVLFALEAAATIKEMKDPELTCRMLQDFARLFLKGSWDDISIKILEWTKNMTGPFARLGGYFNYLNAIGLGAYISEQLGEPGSAKRARLFGKLQAAAVRACRRLTHPEDEHSSAPNRRPSWRGLGAAGAAALAVVAAGYLLLGPGRASVKFAPGKYAGAVVIEHLNACEEFAWGRRNQPPGRSATPAYLTVSPQLTVLKIEYDEGNTVAKDYFQTDEGTLTLTPGHMIGGVRHRTGYYFDVNFTYDSASKQYVGTGTWIIQDGCEGVAPGYPVTITLNPR